MSIPIALPASGAPASMMNRRDRQLKISRKIFQEQGGTNFSDLPASGLVPTSPPPTAPGVRNLTPPSASELPDLRTYSPCRRLPQSLRV